MKLCFPEEVLKQHLVVLGKTGAGKSSTLRHIVEHLLSHKKRVCIIDIKGDWWGLKVSKDGKSGGFPVVAFGDFREPKAQDVPINEHSGKHVAELITSGNRPCIIGFRGWMPGQITNFWLDFAPALFNTNEGELFVVISECHNFAPKGKVLDPKAGRVLHWTNRLLSEGRGLGMTFLLDSQRPQKVHNDTLTSCETLVAMRVTHASDRGAVKDWIDGCGDKSTGTEVLNTLAQLSRGEAWVWSPEIEFGPKRIQFPLFETFDSFAPAQLQPRVSDQGWSTVDLEAVKEKLATVIEEAKENDPKELKARIAKLQRELETVKPAEPQYIADPAAIQDAILKRDEQWLNVITGSQRRIHEELKRIAIVVSDVNLDVDSPAAFTMGHVERTVPTSAVPKPWADFPKYTESKATRPVSNGTGEKLPKAERIILTALAQYPQGRTKVQCALLGSYSHSGGGFNNAVSTLRSKGFIEGDELLRITREGIKALGHFTPLPTGRELLDHWYRNLGKAERTILQVVASRWPRTMSKEDVAAQANYESNGGSFNNALSRLRTFELISGKGELKASDDLFN